MKDWRVIWLCWKNKDDIREINCSNTFLKYVIDSEITSIEKLKKYILNQVGKYSYRRPQEQSIINEIKKMDIYLRETIIALW